MISIHALRVEGDDDWLHRVACKIAISIHALRVEGDLIRHVIHAKRPPAFLSTPSGWRATSRPCFRLTCEDYFYPRPPGGGRRTRRILLIVWRGISIHALRVEGDAVALPEITSAGIYFYPRPPGGGRHKNARVY